ncbi:DUF2306 domain-containing protein [Streptomyces chryseus]|uniref:DUF2306 domain-containing protein n=1 Tax=Streptomyces chryseus TaxID=68186 RepID=A0ABQ3DXJ0_9ACTN|nr:DUF2306 domain-containing protein [Streptomyces chryseus]GGX44909.1 hypothetical protein GCM10010353_69670 [Streptomyces chryseus]GHB17032.1 hypothetical protein GCM10010346_46070 [Streptomyces chryseus]
MTITTTEPERTSGPGRPAAAGPSVRWWRRPWVGPLATVAAVFIAYNVPRYLTFDPADSKIPLAPGHAWHYPVLVAHVVFGTVALVTCCLQVWPALRKKHPKVHRISGRLYVLAGVLPGAVAGVAVAMVSPSGLSMQVSTVTTSVLWAGTAIAGIRMARQRRQDEHRRWMVRSFALTLSIIFSRILGVIYDHTILPMPVTQDIPTLIAWGQARAGLASWPGWIIPLLIAEWWLIERGAAARHKARAARRKAAMPS